MQRHNHARIPAVLEGLLLHLRDEPNLRGILKQPTVLATYLRDHWALESEDEEERLEPDSMEANEAADSHLLSMLLDRMELTREEVQTIKEAFLTLDNRDEVAVTLSLYVSPPLSNLFAESDQE